MADMNKTSLSLANDPKGAAGPTFRMKVSPATDPIRLSAYSADVGMPVSADPDVDGEVILARANSEAGARWLGLAATAGENPGYINVQTGGPLSLPTALWDLRTGQSGGLTPNAIYYVSAATPGQLTTTPPGGGGDYLAPVGFAISPTTMLIVLSLAEPANP